MTVPALSDLRYRVVYSRAGGKSYVLQTGITYYSERYSRYVTVPEGYPSDGATNALDYHSWAWWVHDRICDKPRWDNGEPINNWQASSVLADITRDEARQIWKYDKRKAMARYGRSFSWWFATWLFGCAKARKHGRWLWSRGKNG